MKVKSYAWLNLLLHSLSFTETTSSRIQGISFWCFHSSSTTMANGTRLAQLAEQLTIQALVINDIKRDHALVNDKLADLLATPSELVRRIDSMNHNPPPPPPLPSPPRPNNPDFTPPPRLKFPRFAGTDPHGWIFQSEQYFAYHNIRDHPQLNIASFHLDGITLAWFR